MSHPSTRRIAVGELVAARDLETINGDAVAIPEPDHVVHLQLRRFAGCPVCNLHLQSVVRRHDDIAAGVHDVVVFDSSVDELRKHAAHLPFAGVADPAKRLYAELGAESTPRAWSTPASPGEHAYDQWSVDELLSLARSSPAIATGNLLVSSRGMD